MSWGGPGHHIAPAAARKPTVKAINERRRCIGLVS
jgi:hypothetical protein